MWKELMQESAARLILDNFHYRYSITQNGSKYVSENTYGITYNGKKAFSIQSDSRLKFPLPVLHRFQSLPAFLCRTGIQSHTNHRIHHAAVPVPTGEADAADEMHALFVELSDETAELSESLREISAMWKELMQDAVRSSNFALTSSSVRLAFGKAMDAEALARVSLLVMLNAFLPERMHLCVLSAMLWAKP